MIKRIKIALIQKPLNTTALLLLFTIITAFVFFSLSIYRSANVLRIDTLKQLGTQIAVGAKSDFVDQLFEEHIEKNGDDEELQTLDPANHYDALSQEQINEILQINEVIGVNTISTIDLTPVNFSNSKKYQGENPFEQENSLYMTKEEMEFESHAVNAVGCVDASLYEHFLRNLSELKHGVFPSEENRGALISEVLAEENNLSVGDVLEVKAMRSESDATYSIKIVGIYSTTLYFNISEANDNGTAVFRVSPYNTIFTDYSTVHEIAGTSDELRNLNIYLNSPLDVDSVLNKLKSISINWGKYEAYDFVKTFNFDLISSVENFKNAILNIVLISTLGGIALFVIVFLSLNVTDEFGILFCLGEKKSKILLQKSIEYGLLALIALPLIFILGYFLVSILIEPLNPEPITAGFVVSLFSIGDDMVNYNLNMNLNFIDAVFSVGYLMLLIIIAMALNFYRIYNYKTIKFLQNFGER